MFKHHISVIEGHAKMIDMIRKHTVPNSGNWKTVTAMLDRSHEILRMSKAAAHDFVRRAAVGTVSTLTSSGTAGEPS